MDIRGIRDQLYRFKNIIDSFSGDIAKKNPGEKPIKQKDNAVSISAGSKGRSGRRKKKKK